MLRAGVGGRRLGAVELERQHGGDHQAPDAGVLQPAQRAAGQARGLAADADPVARGRGHVLGDDHGVVHGGLPARRRPHDRPFRPVGGAPAEVWVGREGAPGVDADGGEVDHRRRALQRARPRCRLLHSARGGAAELLLRHPHRRSLANHLSFSTAHVGRAITFHVEIMFSNNGFQFLCVYIYIL